MLTELFVDVSIVTSLRELITFGQCDRNTWKSSSVKTYVTVNIEMSRTHSIPSTLAAWPICAVRF
jgi:hypothetical protein